MRVLRSIQRQLADLYRLECSFDVQAFVAPRSQVDAPLDRPEQVLVREQDNAVELLLVLDDALIEPAVHDSGSPMGLDHFCVCAEGVSHLLYLALAAERESSISQLELELQAEIDKYVLLTFAGGGRPADLIARLFLQTRLRDVSPEERVRYEDANRMALGYCRYLEARYVRTKRTELLLDELRRVYRMVGTRKIGYVSECRP